jgi:polysaccharide export outer membrane protein
MHTISELNNDAVVSSLTHRLLYRVLRGIAIAALTVSCASLAGGMADCQQPQRIAPNPTQMRSPSASTVVSNPGVSDGTQLQLDDCACRNIPGDYPCQGPCQSCMRGVDCKDNCGAEGSWANMPPIDFNAYGHGGYAGPARLAHLRNYRLRPGDTLQVVFLLTRRQAGGAYRLEVGDEVLIESVSDTDLTRGTLESGLRIQPDGSITVRLLGQVHAAGLTVDALRKHLETLYEDLYEEPSIDVTPVRTNRLAEDIRDAVGGQGGFNAQVLPTTVMPDGKVRLPGIGEVCVQGFTLSEMKAEVNLRYSRKVVGLEIEPTLQSQAPHFVHVLGEVGTPARVELVAPTTVLGALAAAGGTLPGSNLRQVVVMRRAEDWRLISTMLDLQGAIYGKRPTPADEIWLQDGDVIIVPAKPILRLNWFVRQTFTEGIYGVVPFGGVSFNFGDGNN